MSHASRAGRPLADLAADPRALAPAGEGLRFIKIGGLVRYRLEDAERFEAEQLRQITGTQQPELAVAERIAPPVRSRRKKSTYAELRSFLLNGRRPVSP